MATLPIAPAAAFLAALIAVAIGLGAWHAPLPDPAVGHRVAQLTKDKIASLTALPRPMEGALKPNTYLRDKAVKLFGNSILGSESVAPGPGKSSITMIDRNGYVWIADVSERETALDRKYRLRSEPLVYLGPGRPLGFQYDGAGNLIVCDSLKGLVMFEGAWEASEAQLRALEGSVSGLLKGAAQAAEARVKGVGEAAGEKVKGLKEAAGERVKGAGQALGENLHAGEEAAGEHVRTVGEAAGEKWREFREAAGERVREFGEAAGARLAGHGEEGVVHAAGERLKDVRDAAGEQLSGSQDKLHSAGERLRDMGEAAGDRLSGQAGSVHSAGERLREVGEAAGERLSGLKDAAGAKLSRGEEVVHSAGERLYDVGEAASERLSGLKDAAGAKLSGGEGMVRSAGERLHGVGQAAGESLSEVGRGQEWLTAGRTRAPAAPRIVVLANRVSPSSPIDPGSLITHTNDLDIAANGTVYFSDCQSIGTALGKHGFYDTFRSWSLGLYSGTSSGRLLRYDPADGSTHVLAKGLWYANGVALAADASFVAVAETNCFTVLRYWLSGAKAGTTDVLIDRLPGFPDGLSRASDGNFWLAIVAPRIPLVPYLRFQLVRAIAAWLPPFLRPVPKPQGLVLKVSPSGEVLGSLWDPSGTSVSMISSVEEHDGRLWLGQLAGKGVGLYPVS